MLAATAAACSSGADGEVSVRWVHLNPVAAPPPRIGAVSAYDSGSGVLNVLGGANKLPFGDHWGWTGRTWVQYASPPIQAQRTEDSVAFDVANRTLVLYGGVPNAVGRQPPPSLQAAQAPYKGTWVWNGNDWASSSAGAQPSPRWGAALAYDGSTRQCLLFGGKDTIDQHIPRATWVWTGSAWVEAHAATNPPPRIDASMAYDPVTKTVLLFGGRSAETGNLLHDTWSWNGSEWSLVANEAPGPSPRAEFAMAYDPALGGIVLIGGQGGKDTETLSDVWLWTGGRWEKVAIVGTQVARAGAAAAYVPSSQGIVLFGGYGPHSGPQRATNSTWVLRRS